MLHKIIDVSNTVVFIWDNNVYSINIGDILHHEFWSGHFENYKVIAIIPTIAITNLGEVERYKDPSLVKIENWTRVSLKIVESCMPGIQHPVGHVFTVDVSTALFYPKLGSKNILISLHPVVIIEG